MKALFATIIALAILPAQQVSPIELALGRRLAEDMRRSETVLASAAAQEYVDRIGDRIAQAMWDGSFPYTFGVIRGNAPLVAHEPVALPGGYVLVRSELFVAANDGSEFAAMLAHSMAHTVLRHGMRDARGQSGPKVFLSGKPGAPGPNELEADRWSVQALERAGLDREALARYLERVLPAGADKDRRLKVLPHGVAPASDADFTTARTEVLRMLNEASPKQAAPSLYGR